jgi:hypothetical protein
MRVLEWGRHGWTRGFIKGKRDLSCVLAPSCHVMPLLGLDAGFTPDAYARLTTSKIVSRIHSSSL